MSRARFTQHDIERALKGARAAGYEVEIVITGDTMRILPRVDASGNDSAEDELRRWMEEKRAREAQRHT